MRAGCPGLRGGFLSPEAEARQALQDSWVGPLLAPSGVWSLSGGFLCVVSAVTPGEELCKYLHGLAALGAEFDGGPVLWGMGLWASDGPAWGQG